MILFPWSNKHDWILGGFEYLHADNVTSNPGSGGAIFASDDVGGGVQLPRAKVTWGVDGTFVDTSASNPLPVVQTGTPALPTGAATETTLAAASAKLPATLGQKAMAASLAVAIASDQGAVPISDASGSLTVDNGGTFAVQSAQSGTWTVQPGNTANTTAWKVDASSVAVPITDNSGSLTVDAPVGTPAFVRLSDGSAAITTLPVSAASLPLPTGAATAAKQPALGTAGSSSTDVLSVQGIASGTAMPVSLASVPSHAVTNAGTFAVQVDVSKAEDLAAVSGDLGVPALAVRRDSASSGVSTDGDYANLSVDATGALRVTGGGGGVQYQEDTAHVSGDTGTLSLAVRRDANTTLVDATGDYAPLQVDASGSLKVAITAGAGSGGTSIADKGAFTEGSTSLTPVGGVYNETISGDPSEDQASAFRITAKRALHVNLRDSSGNELTAGAQYAEDAVHASGDQVTVAGVVRKDTATQLAGTDGDYSVLVNDASGRLHVNVGALPALPSGSNTIGALTANQSVNVAQINGVTTLMGNGVTGTGSQRVTIASDNTAFPISSISTSITPGTAAANLGKAEDAAHSSGDTGVFMLGVRQDADTSPVSADGDYHSPIFNAIGRMKVSVLPATTAAATGNLTAGAQSVTLDCSRQGGCTIQVIGTFSGFNGTFECSNDAGTTYNAVLATRTNAATSELTTGVISANPGYFWKIPTYGMTNVRLRCTAIVSGTVAVTIMPSALLAEPAPAVSVSVGNVTNAGTFAVQDSQKIADNAAFTDGTTPVSPVGFILDETPGTALTENDIAAARVDSKRAQILTLEDATTRGQRAAISAAGALSVTDVAATSGGWTISRTLAAASTNATNVKNAAGQVGGWYVYNAAAAVRYIKFYNSASAPTAGSGTPVMTIGVPAGSAANVEFGKGIPFSTGIGFTMTNLVADADTTALTANDLIFNLFYK